jgi:hypothetical protein
MYFILCISYADVYTSANRTEHVLNNLHFLVTEDTKQQECNGVTCTSCSFLLLNFQEGALSICDPQGALNSYQA